MIDVREQVRLAATERGLLLRGDSVLVAVSGGLDSMVLLHVLGGLAQAHGWRVVVAHFNHQLRARSSDADETFVRRTAQKMSLEFKAGRADVRRVAARLGVSIEMAARQYRHQFLARTAAAFGITKVALAHHADDQVELFFLRLLRGAGPEGLAGMNWTSCSPANSDVHLIRPLLMVTRSELELFATQHHIRFREDATNKELNYERNRIRHELLPLLREKFQPGLSGTVLRSMMLLRAETDFVAQGVRAAGQDQSVSFENLHVALQRRWLRDECLRLGVEANFDLVERLRLHPDQEWMVNPELILWHDGEGKVHARKPSGPEFASTERTVDISGERGGVTFAGLNLTWLVRPWEDSTAALEKGCTGRETFDAEKVGGMIRLRFWRRGDRFQPIGMRTAAKVQDLFTNRKIPREERGKLVVATTASGEIFWIEGLRISEQFKVASRTARCLEWCWAREMLEGR